MFALVRNPYLFAHRVVFVDMQSLACRIDIPTYILDILPKYGYDLDIELAKEIAALYGEDRPDKSYRILGDIPSGTAVDWRQKAGVSDIWEMCMSGASKPVVVRIVGIASNIVANETSSRVVVRSLQPNGFSLARRFLDKVSVNCKVGLNFIDGIHVYTSGHPQAGNAFHLPGKNDIIYADCVVHQIARPNHPIRTVRGRQVDKRLPKAASFVAVNIHVIRKHVVKSDDN